jgi:HPt (histidine-containing phosphotransfer) domain-containing protein
MEPPMTIHVPAGVAPALPAPIDRAHLRRYTMGNLALEVEVLQLFIGQAPSTLREMEHAACAKSWHMAAHTLKGSAKAVGAHRIARVSEQAERTGFDAPDREITLVVLKSALDEASAYIAGLTVPA